MRHGRTAGPRAPSPLLCHKHRRIRPRLQVQGMIKALELGKRCGRRWVFRGVDLESRQRERDSSGAERLWENHPPQNPRTTRARRGELLLLNCRHEDADTYLKGHVLYAHQEPVVLRGTLLDNLSLCPKELRPLLGAKARDLSAGTRSF